MKTFIIEFDDLEYADSSSHKWLMEYIETNLFEFWEYVSHQIVILTPDSITSYELMKVIKDIYGRKVLIAIFEVTINNISGYGPRGFMEFFQIIKHPDFVPAWERGDYDPQYMANMLAKTRRK